MIYIATALPFGLDFAPKTTALIVIVIVTVMQRDFIVSAGFEEPQSNDVSL